MKILLGVLSGVLVLFLGLFFLVNVVYEPEPEKLVFPEGELSDSIFVGQNNNYTYNETLSKTHSFATVPYKVDVPESQGANIGSGCVYEIGGGMFVYVTEYDDMTQVEEGAKRDKVVQMQDILASQFPSALLINYIPEETLVTAEKSGDGFINGFTAHYLADSIGITDGAQLVNAALLGYILDVDMKGFEGKHLYVSVGVQEPTNAKLEAASAVLSTVMQTVRYDKELYEALAKELHLDEYAEEEVAEQAGEGEGGEDAEGVSNVPENQVMERSIYNNQDGATFQVNVNWENYNEDVILELFLPGEQEFCEPLNMTGTSAQFVLANAPEGNYTLRIKNYENCGNISSGDGEGSSSDYVYGDDETGSLMSQDVTGHSLGSDENTTDYSNGSSNYTASETDDYVEPSSNYVTETGDVVSN